MVKALEYILLIFVVMIATMFAIIGVAMTIIKNAINDMINFKGDKEDEQ